MGPRGGGGSSWRKEEIQSGVEGTYPEIADLSGDDADD